MFVHEQGVLIYISVYSVHALLLYW